MSDDNALELSRRKALGALGTIGIAAAGAGAGTTAFLNDEESFDDNQLVAGELDLFVDYYTSYSEDIEGDIVANDETNDGGVSAEYQLSDVKPGDEGKLVFCPKIVDNPAYLWVGSSGFTQYENGLTEPEADVDPTDPADAGSLDTVPSGGGEGELADNIQVTVSYCEPSDDLDTGVEPSDPDDFQTIRELDNPEDYTLTDLLLELQTGFRISTSQDGTYPASEDQDDQVGPCLCIDWEVPTDVGNVIQSDSVVFDFGFSAEQARHNPDAQTPYGTVVSSNGELKTALDNGEPVTFADGYASGIPEVSRTTTFSPSGNPDTYDVFDIDTSAANLDLGSEGDLRQYGYIDEDDGQLDVAAGYVNPNTDVLRIFVNQAEDGIQYIVVTEQLADGSSFTPLGDFYVAKVDASVS